VSAATRAQAGQRGGDGEDQNGEAAFVFEHGPAPHALFVAGRHEVIGGDQI
jgi:hypothetical protein